MKGDEITKARESNVLNSLSGKIAGLQIAQSSSTVGGSSSIQIRWCLFYWFRFFSFILLLTGFQLTMVLIILTERMV